MVIIVVFSRLYNINIKLFDILNYCIIIIVVVVVYNTLKHKAIHLNCATNVILSMPIKIFI